MWVSKWVDYSSKYGLGYQLNNGSTGVFFNDASKLLLDPNNFHFDYLEWRRSINIDVGKQFTLLQYPELLQKKITLLQHFRWYLEGTEKPKPNEKIPDDVKNSNRVFYDLVYVKRWMKTRHALIFRLNNRVVQVHFEDHTEILLSSETKQVTYVNKKADRTLYALSSAMESTNLEMVKRLKYCKDVLAQMLNQSKETQLNAENVPPKHKGNLKSSTSGKDRFQAHPH